MQVKELQSKSQKELAKLLAEKREELRDIRFKVSQRQHGNYKDVSSIRKTIARILTVMKERELLEKVNANTK